MVGVQLHIGQPVAFNIASSTLAIHQQVVFDVVACDKTLGFKHHTVVRFHKPHGTRKALVRGHHAVGCARIVEAFFDQRIECVFEFARGIVPHHNAPRSGGRQRLRELSLELRLYINLSHLFHRTPHHFTGRTDKTILKIQLPTYRKGQHKHFRSLHIKQ